MKDEELFGSYNFSSLAISDSLAARDQYHYHLMNKRNVVGTAIGYLIRRKEEWPKKVGEELRVTSSPIRAG